MYQRATNIRRWCPGYPKYGASSYNRHCALSSTPGDVAECGVREGKSTLYMLEADLLRREYFLFDSFEGLSDPAPGKDSLESAYRAGSTKRIFATDAQAVADRFAERANVNIMTGWIPTRLSEVSDRRFALVNVDVDLYQPTWDAFCFLLSAPGIGGNLTV